MGTALKVGRPKNYTGPAITPVPGGGTGMIPGLAGGASQTKVLMVLNLPKHINDENTKELLSS